MLEAIFGLIVMGCAMWLAIYAVDSFVVIKRSGWRYSLRGLLILMTIVCVTFGALIVVINLSPYLRK